MLVNGFHEMKTFFHAVAVVALTASVAGCASPYMVDRGRDARDVLTATAGLGIGAKVRAGPLYAGLLCSHDVVGLRDSAFGYYTLSMGRGDGVALELDTTVIPFCWPYREWVFGYDAFIARQPVDGRRLKADYEARSHVPFVVTEDMRHQYRTHLEVVLGLGLSARLGVNPGEMLDFLLGWAGIDIFEDDLEAQEQLRISRGLKPRRPGQNPH